MSAGDLVAVDKQLLRILRPKPVHVRDDRRHPTPAAFAPSSADLASPPVRVSVWDADAITFSRAVEIRGGGEFVGFVLSHQALLLVAIELRKPELRAVEDPVGALGCAPEEARWHYGIEGLADGDKATRNEAMRRLADMCVPARGE